MHHYQFIVSYSIAGILIMALMALNFTYRRRLKDTNNLAFYGLFAFAFCMLLADLFAVYCPVLFLPGHPERTLTCTALSAAYYMLQSASCCTTFYYIDSLKPIKRRLGKTALNFSLLPAALMLFVQIYNFARPILFSYDPDGTFISGPLHVLVYILPGIYLVMSVLNVILSRSYISAKIRTDLLIALFIITLCAVLQSFRPDVMMVDFGASLALLYFYFRNNDPQLFVDSQTGALDRQYFIRWIKEHILSSDEICFIIVQVSNMPRVREYYGEDFAATIMQMMYEKLTQINCSGLVFRISANRLLIHSHSAETYRCELEKIRSWYEGESDNASGEHIFRLSVLGLPKKENFPELEYFETYIRFMDAKIDTSAPFVFVENTPEIMEEFLYRQEIDHFLRKAIAENLFSLSFQPIYNLNEKRFTELEVLSRLSHPDLGPISPSTFIELAERNGLIRQVTDRQLTKLCQYLKTNPGILASVDSIKFNLSPMDLMSESHIEGLVNEIIKNELPPEKFTFEVTESLATDFSNALNRLLRYLQNYNIRLSLDDFGSGYANLNSVLSLPVESIKMDRTLVQDITVNNAHAKLYRNLIRTFHGVGLRVICEGVEDAEQAALLESFGADMIQGYYYAKPLSEDELPAFLQIGNEDVQRNQSEAEAVLSCRDHAS